MLHRISGLLLLLVPLFLLIDRDVEASSQYTSVIVETEATLEEMKQSLPEGLSVRFTYRHLFTGYSIVGDAEILEGWKQESDLEMATSPALRYTVTEHANLDLIKVEQARHYGNRAGERLTGKGIKVGVIDTGMDYGHRDLARNFKKGMDFVDLDRDPMEARSVKTGATYHGTHVAGIIAANGSMQGVAPEASLYIYRALGPGGAGTTDQVLAALEQAFVDRVDVVNLSLGSSVNAPDLPITKALDTLVEKGVTAIVSSGNTGPGVWTVGTPGTSSKAITVGASTPKIKVQSLRWSTEEMTVLPLQQAQSFSLGRSYTLVNAGNTIEDISQTDVVGKVAVIERGTVSFFEKLQAAVARGAIGVLFYNSEPGELHAAVEVPVTVAAATLSRENGLHLLSQIKEHGGQLLVRSGETSMVDTLAIFSSRGPVTKTYTIKPDVLAPGVQINSTVPGGYMPLEGTSMSAPYVTGVAALLKEAHPDWGPIEIKSALMTTAIPLKHSNELYHVFEQGAGRISVERAMESTSFYAPTSLTFHKETEQTIHITNKSAHPTTYYIDSGKWSSLFKPTGTLQLAPMEEGDLRLSLKTNGPVTDAMTEGYVTIKENSSTRSIPFLIVTKEPDYPRIQGFVAQYKEDGTALEYEVYLPGGADSLTISRYDADTLVVEDLLEEESNLSSGLRQGKVCLPVENMGEKSLLVVISVRKGAVTEFAGVLLGPG